MIASEKGGRGAERHHGRSAFGDLEVERAMARLLQLGGVQAARVRREVHGTQLHYLDVGQGEPIVLLHGAGGGAANWYRLMGALSARGRVIAVDLPGFGLSDSIVPAAPLGVQVARLVGDLLVDIDVVPAHIVGTSFGGLVAARLAQLPDFSRFRTLTLINAAGLWRKASLQLKTACMPLFQRLALKQTERGARWALEHIMIHRRLDEAHEAALADYLYTTAARTDMRNLGKAYALFGGWRGQTEVLSAAELSALAPRTLVLWGERDRFLPARRRERAAALAAGVSLRIIPGVGHSPNWEAPGEVLEAMMNFWDGTRDEQEEPEERAGSAAE